MTTETTEWATVAEAARRLGLSDRHARRLADRLEQQDRQKQGSNPLRVRLTALAQLWERESTESESPTRATPESASESDSTTEDAVAQARTEERLHAAETMIQELRQDKQMLQDTLEREQKNHLRLLDQLAEERRDLRLFQARPVPFMPSPQEAASSFSVSAEPSLSVSYATEIELGESDSTDSESDSRNAPPQASVSAPKAVPMPPKPSDLSFWQRVMQWLSD